MTNQEVAQVFSDIADMLEIKGEDRYRVQAYRRAAQNILVLPEDVETLWEAGRLREIPGVGEAIAKKIDELLRTGRLTYYEELRAEIPPGVAALLQIPDVGPKTAKTLYEQLNIHSIAELEAAARAGKVRALKGLGAKTEENILRGIEALKQRSTRILLATALPVAEDLLQGLRRCPAALQAEMAGSLRRRKPTVGDIDLLVASEDPAAVVTWFVQLPRVAQVQAQGDTKASVVLRNGLQVDLMVLPPQYYGSLLQHFTGSQAHNVQLRELAREKGLSLSEYGFVDTQGHRIACAREEEVYEKLGLDWIPPELREAAGEIEAAAAHRLPKLIDLPDVRADLQMHTHYSDGTGTIEEMARAALDLGYQFIAITDHSQSLGVAGGLTPERLRQQRTEIDACNRQFAPFRILQGCEVEIRADGSLDFPDDVLAGLDIVLASIHSGMRQDKATMTRRIVRAMRNPYVDILAHPTGRLIGQREPLELDFEAIVDVAAETGTILEINGQPNRLDLDGEHARLALRRGVWLSLGSDAHAPDGLRVLPFAVAMARRGWVEPENVVNTWPLGKLLDYLQRKRTG